MTTLPDLKQLVEWMKANGVIHCKAEGMEILLGPGQLPVHTTVKPLTGKRTKPITDEQLLYAATEGLDDNDYSTED